MNTNETLTLSKQEVFKEITLRSDKIMTVSMILYFVFGLGISFFYDTFLFALAVGGICLLTYFGVRNLLPKYALYQYVGSGLLAVFTAQFIYQMHGQFEMHFWVFVSSTLLITYQNWKLQLPLIILVVVHHASFAWLQYSGMKEIYFTQLEYMDLQAFLFHGALAALIVGICGYWAYDLEKRTYREAEAGSLLKNQLKNVRSNIHFAESISKGDLSVAHQVDDGDELGQSLLKMREGLLQASIREQNEKFINVGLATLGELIRNQSGNLELLSDEFIKALVKYVNANQGGIFLAHETEGTTKLKLVSCYAFERKKYLTKEFEIGETMVGQCYLEKQPIFMTKVPQNYIQITSGLGGANPSCVFIVPLISNDEVVGVLELASFAQFRDVDREFITKTAESFASAVVNTRVTEKIRFLLEDSQMQTEQLKAQEEEVRQNMEELAATQEEMRRQMDQTDKVRRELQEREDVFSLTTILSEADPYGTITLVNSKLTEVSKYSEAELIGKPHNIFRHPDMPKELFQLMWSTIKSGQVFRGIVKNRAKDGSHYWVDACIVPVLDDYGRIVKYTGARYHITDEELALKLYNRQATQLNMPTLKVPDETLA